MATQSRVPIFDLDPYFTVHRLCIFASTLASNHMLKFISLALQELEQSYMVHAWTIAWQYRVGYPYLTLTHILWFTDFASTLTLTQMLKFISRVLQELEQSYLIQACPMGWQHLLGYLYLTLTNISRIQRFCKFSQWFFATAGVTPPSADFFVDLS